MTKMESIIGPRVGTMFERDQLLKYAETKPKFTYNAKDEGFLRFAGENGYPVPKDDTIWCLDFISPGVYQSRLECLWEQYKEEDVAIVTAIVDGKEQQHDLPGDDAIRYSLMTSAVKKDTPYGADLLKSMKLPTEGLKSIAVRGDTIHPKMEFDMDIVVDNSLEENTCRVTYSGETTVNTMSRLDRILASMS